MTSNISTPSVYTTDDTALTAALGLHGLHPTAIDIIGRKWVYKFESSPYLHEVIDAYSRGTLTGSLKMFALIYKDLVGRLRRQTAESGQ